MYGELAGWFHLVTHPKDYVEEAKWYGDQLVRGCNPKTVLELGSGGGNNASHLKARFDLVLTDLSPQMLETSKRINPELEHLQGDMRSLRLGRVFDGVLVHDAVGYICTEDDLRRTIRTCWEHLRPGGAVFIAPDCVRETFEEGVVHGGHDGEDGRSLRFMEWSWDPDPDDCTYRTEYAYMLREPPGPPRVVSETHTLGMFPTSTWLALLHDAGFEAEVVMSPEWDDEYPSQPNFLGVRPFS
jgi:SAM-dependent methyltransferase